MKINIQKRFRNKPFVIAMASFVVLTLKAVFGIELPPGYNEVAESALSLAVMAGIIVDPTTDGLSDGGKDNG